MVGLAGAIGPVGRDVDDFATGLTFFGDETTDVFESGNLTVASVFHPANAETQPARVETTGELLWVWGTVYGYLDPEYGYRPKEDAAPSLTRAEYCKRLYVRDGPSFVAGVNGSFVGLLVDETTGTARFFTDRLGSRPMHYTTTEKSVVFSTQIQVLASVLDDLSFDLDGVCEYLSFERSLGRLTPIKGVKRAHPGALTRVDPESQSEDLDVQWWPEHEPLDRPFGSFVDAFSKLFESAVEERYDPDLDTGVLLSGGSDSRLIMGALPNEGVTGYHINDWRNREADIAERVADVSGKPFVYLERDGDHYERSLEFGSNISNYTSWFQHGHAGGQLEALRDGCDLLVTGHYADTLFKHNYLPYRGVLIPGTSIEFPLYLERDVETTADLVDLYLGTKFHNRKHLRAPPSYLRADDLRAILERNITQVGDKVDHHGVMHESPHDAGLYSESYPLTNTAGRLFFDVMLQAGPFRNPFLDVRLVELMTKLPVAYRLRKNIINASLKRLHPELADLPHPRTNVPLKYPFALQYLGLQVSWLRGKLSDYGTSVSYHTQGSWPDWDELIREHDFVKPVLEDHADLLEATDWIDMERVWDDYERHMSGDDRFDEISSILSFVSMAGTRSILRSNSTEQPSTRPVRTTVGYK